MTKRTPYRDWARVAILVAIVVLSVVSASVVFTGAVVADDELDRSFVGDATGEQGDLIDVTVELNATREGAITLDAEEAGFETVVEFTDESADGYDEITLQYNTHVHTRDDQFHGWRVHPDNDDVTIEEGSTWTLYADDEDDGIDRPLDAGDYLLSVGERWNETAEELENPTGVALMTIEPFEPPEDVELYTAPLGANVTGDAYGNVTITATDTVADGDALLVGVAELGATGLIDGFEAADGDDISQELADEGVVVEIAPASGSGSVWTNDGSGTAHVPLVALDLDAYDGSEFLVQVDYGAADRSFDVGEPYELTLSITEDSPYVDDGTDPIEQRRQFTPETPRLAWDEDADEVPAATNAVLKGTTNVAPGSEIETIVSTPGQFHNSQSTDVTEDGTFEAVYDFTYASVGTEFALNATHAERTAFADRDPAYGDALHHSINATLTEPDDVERADAELTLAASAPPSVEPGENATLDVTVTNDADARTDEYQYVVVIDRETVDTRSMTLEAGESRSESYAFDTSTNATIDWSVTAGEKHSYGTLTVGSGVEDTAGDGVDDVGDGTPGFGVAVALVATLVSAALALRRRERR